MGAYLIDNPPARSQFTTRSKKPTGATILHTAESIMDTVGMDTGAENVAAFIQRRATPGSYHDLVDSDSIVNLVPYHLAAFQDGTGSNSYALSISWACRTTDWPNMSAERRDAFLRQGAEAYRRQQIWLRASGYPPTPIARISAANVSAGLAGFCYHGDRDPGRRSDPGMTSFPFDRFAQLCSQAIGGTPEPPPPPIGDDMFALHDIDTGAIYVVGPHWFRHVNPTEWSIYQHVVTKTLVTTSGGVELIRLVTQQEIVRLAQQLDAGHDLAEVEELQVQIEALSEQISDAIEDSKQPRLP